jgi:hypothetical protein
MSSRPRVLVLYLHQKGTELRLALDQHLHALDHADSRVLYHNAFLKPPRWLAWTAPDLCVLHTSFLAARCYHDFETYRRRFAWVSDLRCPKVALPQDEYDHSAVLERWLLELGATSVYSCFSEQRAVLYPQLETGARVRQTLTGFIDEEAASKVAARMVPHSERPHDVVYRARKLPYWFGSHGQLKHRIAERTSHEADRQGLRTDISTRPEDTIYGEGWLDFLLAGRAVIGCESGSSVLDRHGEIQRRIRQLLADQPDLSFEEVDARMPQGWDSYAFFAVSPRHLEAVIAKTAQVLVEGGYSGVLEPETHYIPLRRDLSNLDEALERLRDADALEAMAERAYRDVYLSGRNNLAVLAEQLLAEAGPRTPRVALPLALARLPRLAAPSPVEGQPLRALVPHLLTFIDALARHPEARRLFLTALRGRLSIPLRGVIKEIVALRILERSRETWSMSVETAGGEVEIRTLDEGARVVEQRLDAPFESVFWNHSAMGPAAPVYPRHPRWGWIWLGADGKYEFAALAELARTDTDAARTLLLRAVGSGDG